MSEIPPLTLHLKFYCISHIKNFKPFLSRFSILHVLLDKTNMLGQCGAKDL